jgi:hypothetical protein
MRVDSYEKSTRGANASDVRFPRLGQWVPENREPEVLWVGALDGRTQGSTKEMALTYCRSGGTRIIQAIRATLPADDSAEALLEMTDLCQRRDYADMGGSS